MADVCAWPVLATLQTSTTDMTYIEFNNILTVIHQNSVYINGGSFSAISLINRTDDARVITPTRTNMLPTCVCLCEMDS